VALIFALIPLVNRISDLSFLATYAGVASFLVIFEVWAKLGTEIDEDRVDHSPVDVDAEDAAEAREEDEERASRRSHSDHK
jgi:hypothetical protein